MNDSLISFNADYLSKVCNPNIVIDIGVGYGSKELYKAFKGARLILIEPLLEYEGYINYYVKKYNAEPIYKAVGAEEGSLAISFNSGKLQKASFLERTAIASYKQTDEVRTVEVTTLQKVFVEKKLASGSILLKIDTEGFELEVLKGGEGVLSLIDYVIAEVSIAKRFEGSYTFEELVCFMYKHGFSVYSFLTMKHFGDELQQRFSDVLFIRTALLTNQ